MDPAGVRQDSPGRKPWEPWRAWMSALTGRCRRLRPFQAGILGAHVARARPWSLLLDPVRVGAWVFLQVRRCVPFPRACALGCPARPFQGHLRPVSASHPGRPAKHLINGTDRGRLLTAVPLRPIMVSQRGRWPQPGKATTPGNGTIGIGIGIAIAIGIDFGIIALPASILRRLIMHCFR